MDVSPCRVLLWLLQPCGSIEEAAALVTMAKASRAVGETRSNARSSRSHLIVRIKVEVLQLSNLTALSPSPTAGSSPRRISLAASKSMKAPPATVTFSMVRRLMPYRNMFAQWPRPAKLASGSECSRGPKLSSFTLHCRRAHHTHEGFLLQGALAG